MSKRRPRVFSFLSLSVGLSMPLAMVGCGRASDPPSSSIDASTTSSPEDARAGEIVRALSSYPALHDRLGRGLALAVDDVGYAAKADRAESTLLAHAPLYADGALDLSSIRRDDVKVHVHALGARPVSGRSIDGAVVYAGAFVDTDVVQVVEGSRAEELRLLRTADAPREARYRVELEGEGSSLVTDGARLTVLARDGAPVFATEPLFAVDARGVRRTLAVRVEPSAGAFVVVATLDTEGLAYPIAVDPAWSSVGTTTARYYHAAIAFGGKVLAVGGVDSASTVLTTTLTFDGSTVGSAGAFGAAREWLTLSPIGTTKVLAVGGFGTAASSNVDVYDGATWTPATALATARYRHTASTLSTGTIVVAGGYGTAGIVGTAEQGTGGAWSSAGTLKTPRYGHAAVVFKTAAGAERVLLVGGYDGTGLPTTSCEVWDGATWTLVKPMGTARSLHTATLLANGKVLVTGGRNGTTFYATGEVYDPVADTWTAVTNSMSSARAEHAAVLFGGSKNYALVAGGYSSNTAVSNASDWYDPATNAFVPGTPMTSARARFTLTALPAGTGEVARAAAIGGTSGPSAFATTIDLFGPKADGVACTVASDCYAPYCTGNLCCNAASCTTGYTCAGGACATSCGTAGTSAACAAGYYCDGSACLGKKANGASCGAAYECNGGICVDGVCCNAPCAGQCESCNVSAGTKGTCTAVVGAPIGGRTACVGAGVGTTCGITCNGTDRNACHYPPTTVACGADTCTEGTTGGTATHVTKCDGAGTCPDTSTTCGFYKCDATACKTTCAADGDCEGGYHCDTATSKCVPDAALGKDCTLSSECGKLTCVDKKCCGTAACGAGESCAYPGKEGTCTKVAGTPCAGDAQCGSGHCVDKVCCDTACNGQCEACDVDKHVGTCTPVDGAPHAPRAACDALGADDCARSQCAGGTARDRCAGFVNGSTVSCDKDVCTPDGKRREHGVCDGVGGCKLPTPSSCAEYACDPAKGACFTACTTGDQCASGYQCDPDKKVCIQGAHCSTDKSESIDKTGAATPCSPYLCGTDGKCAVDCSGSDQCAAGFICDSASRLCVSPTAPPPGGGDSGSGGGCSVGTEGPRRGSVAFGLGILGVLVVARVRRRRAR